MNIQTVIANLLNTIEGKEKMLAEYREAWWAATVVDENQVREDIVTYATIQFLETNIKELNAILTDCMAVREADIVRNLEEREKAIDHTPPKGTHDYI